MKFTIVFPGEKEPVTVETEAGNDRVVIVSRCVTQGELQIHFNVQIEPPGEEMSVEQEGTRH